MEILNLYIIHFDNLENRDPIIKEDLGSFVASEHLSAQGVMSKWIDCKLDKIKPYLGWDGEVYPKYIVKRTYSKK